MMMLMRLGVWWRGGSSGTRVIRESRLVWLGLGVGNLALLLVLASRGQEVRLEPRYGMTGWMLGPMHSMTMWLPGSMHELMRSTLELQRVKTGWLLELPHALRDWILELRCETTG